MYRALVIASSLPQAEEMQTSLTGGKSPHIQFRYPSRVSHDPVTLTDLYLDCCDVIREEEIDVLVCLHPVLNLVEAALRKEFPHILGASLESTFLCLNRYYNRRIISHGFCNTSSLLSVEDLSPTIINGAFEEVGSPAELISTFQTMHYGRTTMRLKHTREFYKEINDIRHQATYTLAQVHEFIKSHIPVQKYPITCEPTCILQELLVGGRCGVTCHYVEGCVSEGEMLPWAISDLVFWDSKPDCVKSVGVPTVLHESVQFNTWAIMREIVQRLVVFGFNNQFLHARVAVLPGGQVKVTDMFSCIVPDNNMLHSHVYQNGDTIRAALDLGLGLSPGRPKLLPNRHALKCVLTTYDSGSVSDILDFKEVRKRPEINLKVKETDELEEAGGGSHHLANVFLLSTTQEACEDGMAQICKDIFKYPESTLSFWINT